MENKKIKLSIKGLAIGFSIGLFLLPLLLSFAIITALFFGYIFDENIFTGGKDFLDIVYEGYVITDKDIAGFLSLTAFFNEMIIESIRASVIFGIIGLMYQYLNYGIENSLDKISTYIKNKTS